MFGLNTIARKLPLALVASAVIVSLGVGIGSYLVGSQGVVRSGGLVFVNGELWRARPVNGRPLEPGEAVSVEAVDEDGLELVVRPSE